MFIDLEKGLKAISDMDIVSRDIWRYEVKPVRETKTIRINEIKTKLDSVKRRLREVEERILKTLAEVRRIEETVDEIIDLLK